MLHELWTTKLLLMHASYWNLNIMWTSFNNLKKRFLAVVTLLSYLVHAEEIICSISLDYSSIYDLEVARHVQGIFSNTTSASTPIQMIGVETAGALKHYRGRCRCPPRYGIWGQCCRQPLLLVDLQKSLSCENSVPILDLQRFIWGYGLYCYRNLSIHVTGVLGCVYRRKTRRHWT